MAEHDAIADLAAAVRDLAARVDAQTWPRWLSVAEASRYTSLSVRSIRNLISAGRVMPSRAVRGKVLIDRLQLDAALSAECGKRLRRGRGIKKSNSGDGARQASATGYSPDRAGSDSPALQSHKKTPGGISTGHNCDRLLNQDSTL